MTAPVSGIHLANSEPGQVSRLLVTRRDPDTREYHSVGFLSWQGGRYRFAYLKSMAESGTFRPLPGFPSGGLAYESTSLFPIFAERIMSPRRPDRPFVMDALGLGLDAPPFEVLARSGGRRVGDTIELVPVPVPSPDGTVSVDFFVHGVRHMTPEAQVRITSLMQDEPLRLIAEPDNAVESRAVLVTELDEVRLGYVPTPLLDLVHNMEHPTATVLRANGPRVGFHFRLLVRTHGSLQGVVPFVGPQWDTVVDSGVHSLALT